MQFFGFFQNALCDLNKKNDVDFSRIFDGDKLIGVLNFNNMIPVDERVITKIDLKINKNDSKQEIYYKTLCTKELDWCQKNQDIIIKKANKLYKLVQKENVSKTLKKRCNDFKKLEKILLKKNSEK